MLQLISGVASSLVTDPKPVLESPSTVRLNEAHAVPVPDNKTTGGLLGSTGALLLIVAVALTTGAAVGLKVRG